MIPRLLFFLCLTVAVFPQTFEKTITVESPQPGASRYSYVPFDVPKDAKSLSVSYRYDRKNGANVIDLGLFDARFDGTENNTEGFRGWSGGRRATVFIAADEASHGYLPGTVSAGTWRVILGLYKIQPEGVSVTVTVRINEIAPDAKATFDEERAVNFDFPKKKRVAAPRSGGLTWFRGDLHAHTFHSDGNWSSNGLLDFSRANNLDFIGLTEHNTTSHHREIARLKRSNPDLLVLSGEEVTTYGGHFNVWGLPDGKLIDFRVTPKDANRLETIAAGVRKLGLVASVNHPTALCGGCDWTYGDWTKMDSVEVWNGLWDSQDEAALRKWDALLNDGKRITAIGSSDTHRPPTVPSEFGTNLPVGTPTIYAGMKKLSEDELFRAIREGHIWTGAGPDFSLEFTAKGPETAQIGGSIAPLKGKITIGFRAEGFPAGASIALISNGAVVNTQKFASPEISFSENLAARPGDYFRVEIRDEKGSMLAFSNTVFVK